MIENEYEVTEGEEYMPEIMRTLGKEPKVTNYFESEGVFGVYIQDAGLIYDSRNNELSILLDKDSGLLKKFDKMRYIKGIRTKKIQLKLENKLKNGRF